MIRLMGNLIMSLSNREYWSPQKILLFNTFQGYPDHEDHFNTYCFVAFVVQGKMLSNSSRKEKECLDCRWKVSHAWNARKISVRRLFWWNCSCHLLLQTPLDLIKRLTHKSYFERGTDLWQDKSLAKTKIRTIYYYAKLHLIRISVHTSSSLCFEFLPSFSILFPVVLHLVLFFPSTFLLLIMPLYTSSSFASCCPTDY